MARARFSFGSFLIRFVFALILVFATYNPLEPWSYFHWALKPLMGSVTDFSILKALVGVVLIIGWGVFLGATFKSLGLIGTILVAALFGLSLWWLIDAGWISLTDSSALDWLLLVAVSGVLAAGISWSHIRRRLTGQVDIDDTEG